MRISIKIAGLVCLFVFIFNSINAQALNKKNLGFIENKGQIADQNHQVNSDLLYMYDCKGLKVQLRKSGYSYELYQTTDFVGLEKGKKNIDVNKLHNAKITSSRIDIDFLGMNQYPEVKSEMRGEAVLNYIINGTTISNIASYNKVTYKNVYPLIDIEFVLTDNETNPFKYNIILNPGADINKINFLISGASSILKSEDGSLNFKTPLGTINENIPLSYYSQSPSEHEKIYFKFSDNIISFTGSYNSNKIFIIDPSTNRIWGTYFGGSSLDFCTSTAVNSSNEVFLAGYSLSTSNIATAGAYQTTLSGSYDAYLAKFNSIGVLQWSTYFGGTGFDIFYNLHIDAAGSIYACGDSNSPSNIATPGAHQIIYGGGIDDGILVKFNTNGQRLWSTYYGGNQHEIINGITTDNTGDLIIAGHTQSPGSISTPGAYSTAYTFSVDVFVVKFNTSGVRQWGTYYGDNDGEEALSADCDASNNIYISGFTTSTQGITTIGSYQSVYGGNQDGFVAKFNPAGSQLLWGTYYGGSGMDNVPKVQLDNSGNIYIGGNTTSPNAIATAVAHQTVLGSADDGFFAKFNSAGVRQWGTYFGGNDVDYVSDFLLDLNNNIVFCGETQSTNNISTAGAYQPTLSVVFDYDAYLAKFNSNGIQKLGTYYGGLNSDNAKAIAMDNTGKVYISGETSSTNAISSAGSYMSNAGGNGDAFLVKFCLAPEPTISPSGSISICNGNGFTLTTQNGYSNYLWNTGATSNPLTVATATSNSSLYFKVIVTDAFGCDGASDSVNVIVSICNSINEVINETNNLNIYPNPVKDLLFVDMANTEINDNATLKIYALNGVMVSTKQITAQNFSVNIKDLPSGFYFLNIQNKNKNFYKKFTKQ